MIYLLKNNPKPWYDRLHVVVIIAASEQRARELAMKAEEIEFVDDKAKCWLDPKVTTCELIGNECEPCVEHVVCADVREA